MKILPKNPECAEITMTSRTDVRPACGQHAAVRFVSFQRTGTGMGKNIGNPDLVCENLIVHTGGQTMLQL